MSNVIGPNGEIEVPELLLHRLGLHPGDEFQLEVVGRELRISRAAEPFRASHPGGLAARLEAAEQADPAADASVHVFPEGDSASA